MHSFCTAARRHTFGGRGDPVSSHLATIPARALDDSRLSHQALKVLCTIATYSDRKGFCWPSMKTLAARLRVSRPTVVEHVGKLIEFGYLARTYRRREDGGSTSSMLRVLYDGELAPEHDSHPADPEDHHGDPVDTLTHQVVDDLEHCPTLPVGPAPTGGVGPGPTGRVGPSADTKNVLQLTDPKERKNGGDTGGPRPPASPPKPPHPDQEALPGLQDQALSPPQSPPRVERGPGGYRVAPDLMAYWRRQYPLVDLPRALDRAYAYDRDKRANTGRWHWTDLAAGLRNWLARDQLRRSRTNGHLAAAPPPPPEETWEERRRRRIPI